MCRAHRLLDIEGVLEAQNYIYVSKDKQDEHKDGATAFNAHGIYECKDGPR